MINRLLNKLYKVMFRTERKPVPIYKGLANEMNIKQDAAIEVDSPPEQWQPEQHGNVVIVEPDLMFQHRRGKV